ncbi:amino acid adenylation domain-containing protein, partial [Nocardia heshunensis]
MGIWYAQQLDPQVPITIAQYVDLPGVIDREILRQACIDASGEFGSGFVRIVERDGEPWQYVDHTLPEHDDVTYLDLRDRDDPEAAAHEWMRAEYGRPIDIVADRLVRVAVLHLSADRCFLYLRAHHIVLDGFSAMSYLNRTAEIYTARVLGTPLEPLRVPDLEGLVESEFAYRESTRFQADKQHWAQRVSGLEQGLSLAGRTAAPASSNRVDTGALSDSQSAVLDAVVKDYDASPATLVIAAFATYLAQWTGSEDVILSLPVTARTTAVMRRAGGVSSNIVPLRLHVGHDATIADLLRQVRVEVSGALRHQRYRHEDIRRDSAGGGVVTTEFFGPWINIMLFHDEIVLGSVAGRMHVLSTGAIEDLAVNVYQSMGGRRTHIDFETNPNIYSDTQAHQHHSRFLDFFDRFVRTDVGHPARSLLITTALELDQALTAGTDTHHDVADTTLSALLDTQSARTPANVALEFEGEALTYAEFEARVNRLARFLIADGVAPESLVALGMRRSVELVVGMHAVVKAGGVYVPIDPDHPAERTAYILESAAPVCVLTTSADALALPETMHRVQIDTLDTSGFSAQPITDADRRAPLSPDNTAYVIYTSGSTGRPKGVAVTHRAIVNQQLWMVDEYQLTSADIYLQKTATTFDVSLWGYFLPLLVGAKLVVASPDGHRDPAYIAEMIERHQVTVTDFVPSMLTVFAGQATVAQCLSLRTVFVIGEALPPETVAGFLSIASAGLHNLYGPTEAAVSVTSWEATAADTVTVPIGVPEWNVGVFVLDARLRPVAIGMTGELYLAGRQLARGYLARPDLTADRFVANPFSAAGTRMYRTGDLVRWNESGVLEYLGRTDFQVKFRGQRIELGEIESVLLAHPTVGQAVVVVADSVTGQQLVAYVVAAQGHSVDPIGLARFAAADVPVYMVPSSIMVLDALPLNTSGKLDRKALPEPVFSADAHDYRAPRTQTEHIVAGIFADVLSRERVGVEDSFFDLGGNSLVATQVVSRVSAAFGVQLGVRALFEAPTAAGLAARAESASALDTSRPQLVVRPRPQHVPLSPAQQRMWFLNQFDPTLPAYNLPFVVRMSGHVDIDALTAALLDVVERQESLRTIFPEFGEGAYQMVVPMNQVAITAAVEDIEEERLGIVLRELAGRGFDVTHELPFRVRLFRLADSVTGVPEHAVAMVVHHIAADGYSFAPLARDIMVAYLARADADAPQWAPLPVQYRDFSIWQRELLGSESDVDSMSARQIAYWRGALAGLPDQVELPADRPRPPVQSFRGSRVTFDIPAERHAQLAGLARAHGVSLFMVVHATLAVLLARLSGTSDIAIGTPVAGRGEQALDDLIGMFVNTLVLRSHVDGSERFSDLLSQIRETDLGAYANADVPFEQLVEVINPVRSQARHPLFQVMLSFQEMPYGQLELAGSSAPTALSVRAHELDVDIAKFDLSWTLTEQRSSAGEPAGVSVVVSYATDLFDAATVDAFGRRYLSVLERAVGQPDALVRDIDILDAAERSSVLGHWNRTEHAVPTMTTVLEGFAAQARRRPHAVALTYDSSGVIEPGSATELTYAEFASRVNRLARKLIDSGVGPETLVAVGIRRSIDTLVAIYAVVTVGGGYVPIDPDHPSDRIDYVLRSSNPVCMLTTRVDGIETDYCPSVFIDDAERAGYSDAPVEATELLGSMRPENTAYVLYTSGSTGRPKGVAVSHAALVNQMMWKIAESGLDDTDIALHKTPFTFDASVWELFAPLMVGARTIIAEPDGHRDALYQSEVIGRYRVTVTSFVPSLLSVFATSASPAECVSLRAIFVGGEVLSPAVVNSFRRISTARVVNLYGPTEYTVNATSWRVDQASPTIVPIGRPVWNAQAYVLDQWLRPVPAGVRGELYLAGAQLSRGYQGRADLTADRFVANPFGEPGSRLYRTGDLVRWIEHTDGESGVLDYIGRTDFQVKFRGQRIELGEIEAALLAHEAVRQAVVAVVDSVAGDQLVGYVVTSGPADTGSIKASLQYLLPTYMVPSALVVLDTLPLNASGKLDRQALPAPVFEVRAFRAPATPIEEIVAQIFGEVLRVVRVGVDDDFFELGGNSLIATQVAARLGAALDTRVPVRMLFEAATVEALAARIESHVGEGARSALVRRERPNEVPLSLAQQRMWFLNRFDTASAVYNIPVAIRLSGELDIAALQVAVIDVIDRHESLRTVFPETAHGPVQRVLDAAQIVPDLTPVPVTESNLIDHLVELATTAFDVTDEVPLHAALFELSETEYILGMVVHHISADGWSMGPLARDVMVAYAARTSWEAPAWAELPVQYADYALWQREVLGSEEDPESLIAKQIRYWADALADLPDELVLPADRSRPGVASYQGGTYPFAISAQTQQALVDLGRRHNASLFMVMHSALAVLLARLSGTSDIAIGTPVHGRGEAALDDLIGMFVNTLVLRTEVDGSETFADLLARSRDADLHAFAHADVPFERLVEVINPARSQSRHPLFQVMLTFQNTRQASLELPGLSVDGIDYDARLAKFDLQLTLQEAQDDRGENAGMSAEISYALDLFDESTVAAFAHRLDLVLAAVVANPELPLGDIDLLVSGEHAQVTGEWTSAGPDSGREATLVDLFEAAVRAHPERIAVVFDGERLTYRELDERANQLARALIRVGARPDMLVAVALPRSAELIVALVAVLKAGAGYLPVDPAYPAERIAFMLSDADPICVVTAADSEMTLPAAVSVLIVDDPALVELDSSALTSADRRGTLHPADIAYVIYTSGSTGRPKGVLVPHRNVVRLFDNTDAWFHFDENDVWTLFHSYAFDFSVWELWGPLLHGGTLVVVDYLTSRSPEQFLELLRRERVTVLNQTPSAFYQLAEADRLAGKSGEPLALRYVVYGGEALELRRLTEWYTRHTDDAPRLINMYGITETTVHVTYRALDHIAVAEAHGSIIGQAIPGLRVFLLDQRLRPVPVGVPGEIYVTGTQLARGYLGRPDLSAARFVASPFGEPGDRLYRSGDVAKWNTDGDLVYLGRADDQVKVRGFRIELGEIEAAVLAQPQVSQAAVIVRIDDHLGDQIVAYLVPASAVVDLEAVKAGLQRTLPSYMAPSAYVVVREIPLTPNGKLDRKALPAPVFEAKRFRAPATPIEEIIAQIFADLLGVERVGGDDDFFELGGNSLVATQVVARLSAALNAAIGVRALFEAPTVAALAARVESHAGTVVRQPLTVQARPQYPPLSLAQQRMWFLNRFDPESAANNIPAAVRLTGALDLDAMRGAITDVIARHESLRTLYPSHEGIAYQQVLPTGPAVPELEVMDVTEGELPGVVAEFVGRGFDVTSELPVRLRLLRLGSSEHVLVLAAHHIAVDGFSIRPLVRDLVGGYAAAVMGVEPGWAPLEVQYVDYALWQREVLGSESDELSLISQQLDYWRDALAGIPDELRLSMRPRPAVASNRAGLLRFRVPGETIDALNEVAQAQGATLFMVVQTAFAVLLSRLSGTTDIAVGTPIAGRGEQALDDLVGMFVNTLVLRTSVDLGERFTGLLAQVRSRDLGAFAHADVPFERVVEMVNPVRSQGRHPLFQVMLSFQNLGHTELTLPDLTVSEVEIDYQTAKFDLQLSLMDGDGAGLSAELVFATDLFDSRFAEVFAQRLLRLLTAVAVDPAARVGELPLMDDVEQALVLDVWNETKYPIDAILPTVSEDSGATLGSLFEAQVALTPEATAITYEGTSLSYAEFADRVRKLARWLVAAGVGPETPVALSMHRSVDLVVGMYAISVAGGVFVPLDPEHPVERIRYVLETVRPICVLTSAAGLKDVDWPLVRIDELDLSDRSGAVVTDADRLVSLRAANTAYVIFTSGSTGRPKGVAVSHQAIVNQLVWMNAQFGLAANDVVLQKTPMSFDASLGEFFWPLQVGARMVVAKPDGHRDPLYLARLIAAEQVTVTQFVPSMLQQYLTVGQAHETHSLRLVFAGGEALPGLAAQKFRALTGARLCNMYGPTESTIDVTYHEVTDADLASVPIGAPHFNTQVYVLDSRLRPVPVGVAGELYLAGDQLATGYVARPDLTADRFVANPFGDGARMYRTGDLVTWTGHGELEYLGRTDFQVKLRGLRIELGEIESALTALPSVAQSVVVVRHDERTGDQLVAYLVAADSHLDLDAVKDAVAERLPAYMVPAAFVVLDAFPLNASGKLDRKLLPAPTFAVRTYRAPETPVQQTVAGTIADVLGLDLVGLDDDFFELGGNSLIATQVIARLSAALDADIPLRTLFEATTVVSLAAQLESRVGTGARAALVAQERPELVPLSLAQQRMWFLNRFDSRTAVNNIPVALKLTGAVDLDAFRAAIGDVLARHESLRTVYPEVEGDGYQRILPPSEVKFEVRSETVSAQELVARVIRLASVHFDVTREVPFRATVLNLGVDEHIVVLVLHHISADGFSLRVLARDVMTAYLSRTTGEAPAWSPLPVQYADYTLWQREILGAETDSESIAAEQIAYWSTQLADLPEQIELPADRTRPEIATNAGGTHDFSIDAELHRALTGVAREHDVTLFMLVHAALATWASRLSRATDIAIGTPIAGRGERAADDLVGMFVNTLVLRSEVKPDTAFRDLLAQVRRTDLAAFAHADVPFERLVDV